jgi:hypothetical protein
MSDNPRSYTLPPLPWLLACAEIGLIIVCSLFFTSHLLSPVPQLTIQGDEFAFLLNSGQFASIIFQKTGAIPLWNPFIGSGEPLVGGLFSFILNPLMSLPMLAGNPIVGARLSIELHILLMGIGGWAFARMLQLKSAGRIFLGLLLASSGSFASAVGAGFYEIGLSLAYVPWIMTGLIGVLYLPRRWPICLLAAAATLMILAGTFWYILPTAIVAAALSAYTFATRQSVRSALKRLIGAAVLTAGLSAVYLLPQITMGLVSHLAEPLNTTYALGDILNAFFSPTTPPIEGFQYNMFAYHYVLPLALGIVLLLIRLARIGKPPRPGERQVLIPALCFVIFFTLWAQEGTPIFRWLYTYVPLLQQWRSPVRMSAVTAFWIAVVAAIWFDDSVRWLGRQTLESASARPNRISDLQSVGAGIFLGLLLIGTLLSVCDLFTNWTRVVTVGSVYRRPDETQGLTYLRLQHPNEFLSVETEGIFGGYTFYSTLTRAATGNPNAFTHGQPSTLGSDSALAVPPEYAVGMGETYQKNLRERGYEPVPGAPHPLDTDVLWRNPNVPAYAFLVKPDVLANRTEPLTRGETQPVTTITHNIDSIRVTVKDHMPGAILVVQETAYPGWTVSINDQPANLESVGGKLGLVLPDGAAPVDVLFSYKPVLVYVGAVISLASVLAFAIFALGPHPSRSPLQRAF